jgi:hypothetical protein
MRVPLMPLELHPAPLVKMPEEPAISSTSVTFGLADEKLIQ